LSANKKFAKGKARGKVNSNREGDNTMLTSAGVPVPGTVPYLYYIATVRYTRYGTVLTGAPTVPKIGISNEFMYKKIMQNKVLLQLIKMFFLFINGVKRSAPQTRNKKVNYVQKMKKRNMSKIKKGNNGICIPCTLALFSNNLAQATLKTAQIVVHLQQKSGHTFIDKTKKKCM
jgi:hypothetical protein